MEDFDALIEEKFTADTEFAATLESLSDEEKTTAIETKKKEIRNNEWKSLTSQQKKASELAENYKIRAEKAEKARKEKQGKEENGGAPETSPDNLTTSDLFALMNAKISEEDIVEVQKAAKLLGKSIPETLKDGMVQSLLADKAEKRRTAQAANSGPARPGAKKPSFEELEKRVMAGEVLKGDEADAYFWGSRGGKK